MDCGTCETSGPVQVMTPEVVNVNLTISSKAQEMLGDAFGDDRSMALLVGVLSGGCSGYMYDLQIVEETDQSCQEVIIDGFRVYNQYMKYNFFKSIYYLFCLSLNFLKKKFND